MPKLQVDKQLIRELGELLDETNLTEIEVCEGTRSVRVARGATATVAAAAPAPVAMADVAPAATADAAAPVGDDPVNHPGAVCSPMVGTVYLAPQPGADVFVKSGDSVVEGQTLLIVEAMKVMNQIPAPRAGIVKDVLVQDAQPVEYGDALVIIE